MTGSYVRTSGTPEPSLEPDAASGETILTPDLNLRAGNALKQQ
jgi:hypothetical protein